MKSHMRKKLNSFQHLGNILTDSESPAIKFFRTDLTCAMCIYRSKIIIYHVKVHKFWKGNKILRNLHLTLTVCTAVKSKVKILQNFVAFSEYMNFTMQIFSRNSLKWIFKVWPWCCLFQYGLPVKILIRRCITCPPEWLE